MGEAVLLQVAQRWPWGSDKNHKIVIIIIGLMVVILVLKSANLRYFSLTISLKQEP